MKRRLRDILTDAVQRERDIELIPWEIDRQVTSAELVPDVVVGERPDPLDASFALQVLNALPRARVLLISSSGERAALHELRPTHRMFVDLSLAQVLKAIRSDIREDGSPPAGRAGEST